MKISGKVESSVGILEGKFGGNESGSHNEGLAGLKIEHHNWILLRPFLHKQRQSIFPKWLLSARINCFYLCSWSPSVLELLCIHVINTGLHLWIAPQIINLHMTLEEQQIRDQGS